MEGGDWEYIQGLIHDGTLLEKEPNADKEIAPDHKYRAEICRALATAREGSARPARERAEKERLEREQHEREAKERAAREARDRAERERLIKLEEEKVALEKERLRIEAETRRFVDAVATIVIEVKALNVDALLSRAIEAERHAYLADQRARTQTDIDVSQEVDKQSKRANAATQEATKQSRIITDAEAEIKKQASIATDALQQAETQRHTNPIAVAEVKRLTDIAIAAGLEAKKYFDAATAALVSAKAHATTVTEAYKEAEKGDISLQKEIEKREEGAASIAALLVSQPSSVSAGSRVSSTVVSFWHARCDSKSHSDTIFVGIKRENRREANKDLEQHEYDVHNGRETPSGRVTPTT